jgi:hypothetical protein
VTGTEHPRRPDTPAVNERASVRDDLRMSYVLELHVPLAS